MAKEIILYNLRDDAIDKDYQKWCEDFKGPLKYVGILHSTSLETWNQDRNTKTFRKES